MYNFYQSPLRKTLNKDIFEKPTCDVDIFGKTYQGIIWEKKQYGVTQRWIQILGVEGLTTSQLSTIKKLLHPLKKLYNPMFIQLGFVDVLADVESSKADDGIIIDNARDKRNKAIEAMKKLCLCKSPKENLPPSTYILNLAQDLEKLRGKLSSQTSTKIKKAVKNNVYCSIADIDEAIAFYDLLVSTGQQKGFGITTKESFLRLINYCYTQNTGVMYIARHEDKIVGGALYLIDHDAKTAIYLYGATDRNAGNIGVGQAVHRYAIGDLQQKCIKTIDLLGGGPIGEKDHPLYQVGLFKEGFGGEKIEYTGSFDLVYNTLLYRIRKKRITK